MEESVKQSKQIFGLVGRDISYSFSKKYFSQKFEQSNLQNYQYVNFDIQSIEEFPKVIHEFKYNLKGLNITIPYKQDVFLYLDKVDETAQKIGAVNTVKITKKGNLKGFNTDVIGFKSSILPLLTKEHSQALILGTGGASKAVSYVLEDLGIPFKKVSRKPKKKKEISYKDISKDLIKQTKLLINCTPLGTFPKVDKKPKIPYESIGSDHLLYDLIYNPEMTAFLKEGKSRGAQVKNGYEMLKLQAEASWEIWNT